MVWIRKRVFHIMSGALNWLSLFVDLWLIKLIGLFLISYPICAPALQHSVLIAFVLRKLRVEFLIVGLVLLTKVLLVTSEFRLHAWGLTKVVW